VTKACLLALLLGFGLFAWLFALRPDQLLVRYYDADKAAEMMRGPLFPVFVSVGRMVGCLLVGVAAQMASRGFGDGEPATLAPDGIRLSVGPPDPTVLCERHRQASPSIPYFTPPLFRAPRQASTRAPSSCRRV